MTIASRLLRHAAGSLALGLAFLFTPISGPLPEAQAQRAAVSVEFRTALEPYGRWHRHSRWGEVWLPADRARDWRPYTVGRWVYTDDWGWYWVSDDAEASWGWVTYHYGRWVFDRELGWVWVPGNEWGPAWVNWRRGHQHVGWAPLPPDDIIVEYRDEPDVWIFVRSRDFIAPRITTVILPPRERAVYIRETVVVNRTVIVRDGGPVVAVNPGIAPAIIAASVGRPLRAYDVRPRVLAGTARIEGAVEVSADDLRDRRKREATRVSVRETKTEIRPAEKVPEPQPLAANEQGRLGDNPPRAARAATGDQKDPKAREAERDQKDQKAREAERDQKDQKAREADRDQKDQKAREAERDQKDQKAREAERDKKDQKAREAERDQKDQKAREAERDQKDQKAREAERDRKEQKAREAERDQKDQKAREAERDRKDQKAREAERDRKDQKARDAGREQKQGREAKEKPSAPAATEGRSPPPERAAPRKPAAPSARPDGDGRGKPDAGPRSEAPQRGAPPAASRGPSGKPSAKPPAAADSPVPGGAPGGPGGAGKKD